MALLRELAAGGSALELGAGDGRVALPLAAAGVDVHAVEISPEMIDLLRARPGGTDLRVSRQDITDFDFGERYSLVYSVFATLFALPTQEAQIRCLASAARHLERGGRIVIETIVPLPGRFRSGQLVDARHVGDEVMIVAALNSLVEQVVTAQFIVLGPSGIRMYPIRLRWAWPAELDLMARLAGLRLVERWAGWGRERFTDASETHVSIYEALTV